MRNVLPYFKPPYPAIKRFCQLCKTECGSDQYETQEVRDIEARAKGGQYVFCIRCNEIVGDIAELVESRRAQRMSEAEQATQVELEALVRQAIADRTPSHGVDHRSSSPSGANEAARIPPVRRRGTSIPGSVNGKTAA